MSSALDTDIEWSSSAAGRCSSHSNNELFSFCSGYNPSGVKVDFLEGCLVEEKKEPNATFSCFGGEETESWCERSLGLESIYFLMPLNDKSRARAHSLTVRFLRCMPVLPLRSRLSHDVSPSTKLCLFPSSSFVRCASGIRQS